MEELAGEIVRYWGMVAKRRYLFVGVAMAVMTAFIVNAYFMSKKYEADTTVFIEKSMINNLVKGLAITPDMDERIRVLKYALLSRDIITKVLKDLNVKVDNEAALQDLVADLQQRTNIVVNGKDLFTVSIVDKSPVFAEKFLNTLVNTYVAESLSGKRAETSGANRFLGEQLAQFKTKLDQAEDAIIAYRKSHGVLLTMDEKSVLQSIADYRQQMEEITLSVDTLKARRQRLLRQLKTVAKTVAVVGDRPSTPMSVPQLEAKLQKLRLTYTEDYPEVVKVKAELAEMRQRQAQAGGSGQGPELQGLNPLHQETQKKIYDAEAEISALQGKKAALAQFMKKREEELKQVPENQKQLASLIQERDSYRKIYEEMLMRRSQSEVSKQMEIGDKATIFRVVDAALLPNVPISPNMSKMILLAIVIGLGAGLGAALLRETLDSSIKGVQQVRELGVEVLAVVPGIVDSRQILMRKRLDRLLYGTGGLYLVGVLALFFYEMVKRIDVH